MALWNWWITFTDNIRAIVIDNIVEKKIELHWAERPDVRIYLLTIQSQYVKICFSLMLWQVPKINGFKKWLSVVFGFLKSAPIIGVVITG